MNEEQLNPIPPFQPQEKVIEGNKDYIISGASIATIVKMIYSLPYEKRDFIKAIEQHLFNVRELTQDDLKSQQLELDLNTEA